MKIMMFKKIGALLLLLVAFTAFGQQKQVQTSIDSTKIKIGSQANITIKATVKPKDKVNFPQGKNFGLLEVLESYPVDTVVDGTRLQLIKKYGVTQFDSGRYVIPRLNQHHQQPRRRFRNLADDTADARHHRRPSRACRLRPLRYSAPAGGYQQQNHTN